MLRFRLKTGGLTHTLIANSGRIVPGSWAHVAAVYDGMRMRLYKDGIEVGSLAKTGRLDVNPSIQAWIGGNPPRAAQKPFRGRIDEVCIYRRALTAAEIATLSTRRPK